MAAYVADQRARCAPERSAAPSDRPTVHLIGTVFFDLVFSELSSAPQPGSEVHCGGLGLAPGGVANLAVALARLGAATSLTTVLADDPFGRFLGATLAQEGVDCSSATAVAGWTTPTTVSLAYSGERSLVTYQEPSGVRLVDQVPADLGVDALYADLGACDRDSIARWRRSATLVAADLGWDPSEEWSPDVLDSLDMVDVFLPNAAEAVGYAHARDPLGAARVLARRVGLVVVKLGAGGALALGDPDGQAVLEPALVVEARDTTGAGDVFDAGFLYASACGWPLEHRLRFAHLCAGLSVRYAAGSLSAPCWRDIAAWWDTVSDDAVASRYAFLERVLADAPIGRVCQRACPTFSLLSEMELDAGAPAPDAGRSGSPGAGRHAPATSPGTE